VIVVVTELASKSSRGAELLPMASIDRNTRPAKDAIGQLGKQVAYLESRTAYRMRGEFQTRELRHRQSLGVISLLRLDSSMKS
jgi:hypothetical protein